MTTTTSTTPAPTLDGTPRFAGTDFSSLCAYAPRPQLFTGLFIDILQRHFSAPERVEEPDLRHLLWHGDEGATILIESHHRWLPTQVERRPAIVVKRNAYSNFRAGVGDALQGNAANLQGDRTYSTFWVGSHTCFCIGGSGAQAELLGGEVQRELSQFGPEILRHADLHRWQVTEIGAVGILEEHHENFVVPVTVAYAYNETWTLRQEAPRLNAIGLTTLRNIFGF